MKNITHDQLAKRVLALSKKHKLSHIGSCISILPLLMDIYEQKKEGDRIVFSNGHSHLAHLVAREAYEGLESLEELLKLNGIHCSTSIGCDASAGSLGHGGGISIGFALANKNITAYWIMSDGSLNESSDFESLRIINDNKISNIKMYANLNSFTATMKIDRGYLSERIKAFHPDVNIYYTNNGEGFDSIEGHYKQL